MGNADLDTGEPLLEEQPFAQLLISATAALANLHQALVKVHPSLARYCILPRVHATD